MGDLCQGCKGNLLHRRVGGKSLAGWRAPSMLGPPSPAVVPVGRPRRSIRGRNPVRMGTAEGHMAEEHRRHDEAHIIRRGRSTVEEVGVAVARYTLRPVAGTRAA